MMAKISQYTVPGLGVLCVVGAVGVAVSLHTSSQPDVAMDEGSVYEPQEAKTLELDSSVPTMEEVVEKHLFVKERKATGANTFPDLVIKGTYVGEKQSVVFSLKSRPEINLRVWLDDVQSVIDNIKEERDPRKTIVDFLNEWDLKEITFKGVTVEHFMTGETETYEVDYTPSKHVKDNAEAGYGQGKLATSSQGKTKSKTTKTTRQRSTARSQTMQQRMKMMGQMRGMIEQMSPEQRARFAERIAGRQQGDNQQNNNSSKRNSSNSGSSGRNSSRSSSRSSGR